MSTNNVGAETRCHCGLVHKVCRCGRARVICPPDEPGEPFAWCELCEVEQMPTACPTCGSHKLTRRGQAVVNLEEHLTGPTVMVGHGHAGDMERPLTGGNVDSDETGDTDRRIGVWTHICNACGHTWPVNARAEQQDSTGGWQLPGGLWTRTQLEAEFEQIVGRLPDRDEFDQLLERLHKSTVADDLELAVVARETIREACRDIERTQLYCEHGRPNRLHPLYQGCRECDRLEHADLVCDLRRGT